MERSDGELILWTIYRKPRDLPEVEFAARKSLVGIKQWGHTEDLITGKLEELRERFTSMGLVNIGRMPEDDPVIVETWV